ncbi:hypothetical protein H4219_004532 [Mycoemilia scoparia]|uniref:Multiple inositol polyphosphate phosphatase 1 n=1 Tax=Mycoemilia scoparia TaxID=417184 RepID=A0A9W8DLC4_9FUNG|nr:hypothetical protein H4219_004532 [Mycoemilia scoparia]
MEKLWWGYFGSNYKAAANSNYSHNKNVNGDGQNGVESIVFDTNNIPRHLGTRTPYWTLPQSIVEQDISVPSEFKIIMVEYLVRHGTRYPKSDDMDDYLALAEKLRTYGTTADAKKVANWFTSSSLFTNKFLDAELSTAGNLDHYTLGKRTRVRYHDLLEPRYHPERYQFMSSELARTAESAMSFSLGLFEGTGNLGQSRMDAVFTKTLPLGQDMELAAKLSCPAWQSGFADEKKSVIKPQTKVFDQTHDIPAHSKLARRFGMSMGNNKGSDLTMKDISVLYQACGFQYANTQEAGQFCSLLDDYDRMLLEYRDEIKYTHKYGVSGPEINKDMACQLFSNIVNELESRIETDIKDSIELENNNNRKLADRDSNGIKSNRRRGVFRFGHSETIFFLSNILQPIRPEINGGSSNGGGPNGTVSPYKQQYLSDSSVGGDNRPSFDFIRDHKRSVGGDAKDYERFYKDDEFMGDWTLDQIKNRVFRSSQVSPFAANFIFELYKREHGFIDVAATTKATSKPGAAGDGRRMTGQNKRSPVDSYYVRVLANEVPVVIPGCIKEGNSDLSLCSWKTFVSIFEDVVNKCDLVKECNNKQQE